MDNQFNGVKAKRKDFGPILICKECLYVVGVLRYATPNPEAPDKYNWDTYEKFGKGFCANNNERQKYCQQCGNEVSTYNTDVNETIATGVHFAIGKWHSDWCWYLPHTWWAGYWEIKEFNLPFKVSR